MTFEGGNATSARFGFSWAQKLAKNLEHHINQPIAPLTSHLLRSICCLFVHWYCNCFLATLLASLSTIYVYCNKKIKLSFLLHKHKMKMRRQHGLHFAREWPLGDRGTEALGTLVRGCSLVRPWSRVAARFHHVSGHDNARGPCGPPSLDNFFFARLGWDGRGSTARSAPLDLVKPPGQLPREPASVGLRHCKLLFLAAKALQNISIRLVIVYGKWRKRGVHCCFQVDLTELVGKWHIHFYTCATSK